MGKVQGKQFLVYFEFDDIKLIPVNKVLEVDLKDNAGQQYFSLDKKFLILILDICFNNNYRKKIPEIPKSRENSAIGGFNDKD